MIVEEDDFIMQTKINAEDGTISCVNVTCSKCGQDYTIKNQSVGLFIFSAVVPPCPNCTNRSEIWEIGQQ